MAHKYVDRLELIGGNLYLKETGLPVLGTATAYLQAHSNPLRLAIPALANAVRRRERYDVPTAADFEPTVQALAEGAPPGRRSGSPISGRIHR